MGTDVKWSKEQVRSTLSAALLRLKRDPNSFVVTNVGKEVTLKNSNINNWVNITVYKNTWRVFMAIGEFTGTSDEPSIIPWQDKELKAVLRQVCAIKNEVAQSSIDEMLLKYFPEMTDTEFEQHVISRP